MSGLKKTKPLVKSGLKRKPLQKAIKPRQPRKRVPLEKKNAQQLTKVADTWFSRYVRLRDSAYVGTSWVGNCITCDRALTVKNEDKWISSSQNGHFVGRGFHVTRFNEYNCHLQCAHCNAWLDKREMIDRYTKAVARLYGEDTVTELIELSKAPNARKMLTKPELLQIISDAKEYIAHAERNPDHYA